ncbi:hypothetical protein TWF730_006980 [Orbilia blumenaviensis]|uniref:Uncharacterized protein n=1 Tax=Orbilia blumenaviensis TaxID=1796055 RepID=A0AAV9VG85_9PEZI
MEIFDIKLGDNAIRFRLQYLLAMREKEKIPDSTVKTLKRYLVKLDPKNVLEECTEVLPLEYQGDPQNLPRKVGEHPDVLIRLILLYAYLRSPDRAANSKKTAREEVEPDQTIVSLLWWVFVKYAYQNTRPFYLPQAIKLFTKYESWFIPLIKENWKADPDRCSDIMVGWFLNGLEKYGTLFRQTEPQNHPIMRQLFRHQAGVEIAVCLLDYHTHAERIPLFDSNKDRIIVSAYTMLYYAAKVSQKYHDEDVLTATIKTMSHVFLNIKYYDIPEDYRPEGYEGMRKMGMEILSGAKPAALEKALVVCRTEANWNTVRDTIVGMYDRCRRCASNAFSPPPNVNQAHYDEIMKRFNDSAVCLTHVFELLLILIPRDRMMRLRLRHYDTTTTVCKLIDIFVAKPDKTPGSSNRRATPVAAFSRVPKPARERLAQLMKCCAGYLQALFREWSADDAVDSEMLVQRDIILELAAEGEVAGDILLRAERATRF